MTTINTKLSNGLEVCLVEVESKTVGISLIGNAGALYAVPGLAHFLEHTVLCATKKYPDFISLANVVDNLGVYRNAYTSQETINFVFKCLPEHLPQAFEFLSEVTTNALFLDSDIEKQKKIVIQEINKQNSDSNTSARLVALGNLYNQVGPGIPGLGTEKDIEDMSRDALIDFYKTAFVSGNFKLVVSGRFDTESVLALTEATLGKMPAGPMMSPKNVSVEVATRETRVSQKRDGLKQAVLSMAWDGYKSDDELRYAAYMFRMLMAEGRLSRLWQSLRQKNALVYSTSCFLVRQKSFGYFSITTGLATENIEKAIGEIKSEIQKLADTLISDEDFTRVRNMVRTSLVFESDSAFDLANYYSGKLIWDKSFTNLEEELKKYESVTKEDIRKVAIKFATENVHIAVITP